MKFIFDNFKLDTEIAALMAGDEEVALEPRAYNLLVFLVENRTRLVTKQEIIDAVWGGRFTSDAALTTCLKSLRGGLKDDGNQQRYIKTLRGKGFRFVAEGIDIGETPARYTITTPTEPSVLTLAPAKIQGKPSIIVLPFQCGSRIDQDSVIAEAIAHELILALSRLRWLRVIARGTAFQFRMPAPNLKAIGEQLNLRYALCGSLEAVGQKYLIAVELSDCETAEVIWAEHFEVTPDQLQDIRRRITTSVIAALEMYIPLNEARLATLNTSEHWDSWANYHLGLRYMFRFTPHDNAQAAHYFSQAINQDKQFARAYAGLSFTRFQDAFLGYTADTRLAIEDARRLAEQSVDLDPLDPFTNYNMGRSFWLNGEADAGLGWLERSVALSPSFAQGHYSRAFCEIMQGKSDRALENTELALHLSPLDPLLYANYAIKAFSYLNRHDLTQAVHWAEKAASAPGAHYLIYMISSAMYAIAGDMQKSHYWRTRVLALKPEANASLFFSAFPFTDHTLQTSLKKGLQSAGFD